MKQCEKCSRKFPDHMVFCPFDGDILDSEVEDPLLGCVLDGKYRLEEKLGEGGMGTVYRAKHVLIDNDLAVKVLHSSLVADRHAVARFQREAMAAARIKHPNAVGVSDFGITELEDKRLGQVVYIVMELFIGHSLRDVIEQDGPLSVDRAVTVIRQVCLALDAAHRSGVIHRDVKPDNIVLDKNGQGEMVKVLDFGIAKLKDGPSNETRRGRLTRQGVIIGSPHYLSPEQCQNSELDARSDIYSLGIVLYEMLIGDVPFKAPTPIAVAMMHTTDQPVPVRERRPDVPIPIERVIMRALEKLPEHRPQSALELAQELERACLEAAVPVLPLPGSTAPFTILNDDPDYQSGQISAVRAAANRSGSNPVPPDRWPGNASNNGANNSDGLEIVIPTKSVTASMSPDRYEDRSARSEDRSSPIDQSSPPEKSGFYSSSSSSPTHGLNESISSKVPTFSQIDSPSKKSSRAILFGGIAAVFLLIAAGASYFLFFNSASETGGNSGGSSDPIIVAPPGMVLVKGGDFKMGTNRGEEYEGPEHVANVGPFFIDKTEVTNEEYKKFIDAAKYDPPKSWKNGQYPSGADLKPVTGVDWADALAYATWADKRLPTETEWEYAARGSDGRIYPWGNEWVDGAAVSKELGGDGPRTAGSVPKGASPFGVLDMSGNVWEWTDKTFAPYPGNAAPIDSKLRGLKIIRGGSFKSDKKFLTAYLRNMVETNFKDPSLGFRCAKSAQ